MRRAALFVGLVVFAWLLWDTGADPVRLARGVPGILDFLRRMMPPTCRCCRPRWPAPSRRWRSRCSAPRSPLAVVAYTTTSLAKLYSEAIEGIDPGPMDAVTATGATRLQVLRYGVLPQVRRRRRHRLLPADRARLV